MVRRLLVEDKFASNSDPHGVLAVAMILQMFQVSKEFRMSLHWELYLMWSSKEKFAHDGSVWFSQHLMIGLQTQSEAKPDAKAPETGKWMLTVSSLPAICEATPAREG